jgi:outer membrane protein assembly factor BamB
MPKRRKLGVFAGGVAALLLVGGSTAGAAPTSGAFNRPGNVLIADQFNNRIVEVNSEHEVVWSFGNGSSVAGPRSIVGPNDVERVGSTTLIAGTGAPAGSEPTCAAACNDNRVILVNRDGEIIWQYGQAGVAGTGPNQLNTPVFAAALPHHHVLITDQANERVIEVDQAHNIVWQYGMTGVTGDGHEQLNNPNSSELLTNGHVLIADENNNRVIEVTRSGDIVWQYGKVTTPSVLSGAAFASRLPNGDTLITDSNNARILEVNRDKQVVWSYAVAIVSTLPAPLPTRAVRLANGDTLISNQFYDQVLSVTHAGTIDFAQGHLGVVGTGFNQLNAPYDAKVIGDYTGLTKP